MLKGLLSKIAATVGDAPPTALTPDPLTTDTSDWALTYNDVALRTQTGPKSFSKVVSSNAVAAGSRQLEAIAEKLVKANTASATSAGRPFSNPYRLDPSTSPATGCYHYPPAGLTDVDDRVRYRAVAATTTNGSGSLASARLVAYDSVRQLAAVLVAGASTTIGTQGRAAAREGQLVGDGSVSGGYRCGACVYLIGYGGLPVDVPACSGFALPFPGCAQAIPLPDVCSNELWIEMSLVAGSHAVVLLGRDGMCVIDCKTASAYIPNSSSSKGQDSSTYDARYIERPPLSVPFSGSSSSSSSSGPRFSLDYCFSKLCVDMPLGLPFTAAGTTNGRVLFAPLHPSYEGGGGGPRPQYWSQYEANLTFMLDTSDISPLVQKRRGEARCARRERMRLGGSSSHGAVGSPQHFTPKDLSPMDAAALDADDEVMSLSAYSSDPNAFIASTRNSWGVVKWYVLEDRISAMFLLPNVAGPCEEDVNGGGGFDGVRRIYVASCKVTPGGGYVVGLTNTMTLFTWNEQNHKTKSRGVPALSRVDLLLASPGGTPSSNPNGILMRSGEDKWAELDEASASRCRDVLVSTPHTTFLDVITTTTTTTANPLAAVANAAHAIITKSNQLGSPSPGSPTNRGPPGAGSPPGSQETSWVCVTVPTRVRGHDGRHQTTLFRATLDCERKRLSADGVAELVLPGTATVDISDLPKDIDPVGSPIGDGATEVTSPVNGCLGGGEKERLLRSGWQCRVSIVPMHPNAPWPGDPRGAVTPSGTLPPSTSHVVGGYLCAISHERVSHTNVPAWYAAPSSKKGPKGGSPAPDSNNSLFKRYCVSRILIDAPILGFPDSHFSGLHAVLVDTRSGALGGTVRPIGPLFTTPRLTAAKSADAASILYPQSNQLVLVRCHHRRLMYDKVNQLLTAVGRVSNNVSVDALQGSAIVNGLLQGGSTTSSTRGAGNAFAVDDGSVGAVSAVNPRTGRAVRKLRPYLSQAPSDAGYFLIHQAPSSDGVLVARVYPFSGDQAIAPSSGSLVGCALAPPAPPAAASTRTALFSTPVFGGSMIVSLIRVVTPCPKRAEDDREPCVESYLIKVTSQRLLGADEDSDGDNDVGYSSADASSTAHPAAPQSTLRGRFDSSAISSGESAVPVLEVLVPRYCPMMASVTQNVVRSARLLQGSLAASTPAVGSSRQAAAFPFMSLNGFSIAFVMQDNTVVVSSIADLVRAHETVWGLGGAGVVDVASLVMSQTLHVPAFLFPAGLATTAFDFFTVPYVGPPPTATGGNPSNLILVAGLSAPTSSQQLPTSQQGVAPTLFVFNLTTQAVVSCRRVQSEFSGSTFDDLSLGTPANGHFSFSYREDGGDLSMGRSDPTLLPSALRDAFISLLPGIVAGCKASARGASSGSANNVEATRAATRLYSMLSLLCPTIDPSHPLLGVAYSDAVVGATRCIPVASYEVRMGPSDHRVLSAAIATYPQNTAAFPPQLPFTPSQPPPYMSSPSLGRSDDPVSVGGATYITMEVSLSCGMLTFGDIKGRYVNSKGHTTCTSPSPEVVLGVSLVDVFGLPIVGLEVAIGAAQGTNPSSPTTSKTAAPLPPPSDENVVPPPGAAIDNAAPLTVFIGISDCSMFRSTTKWVPLPQEMEQLYAGVSLTRCLTTGVATISLKPVAFTSSSTDAPPPHSLATLTTALPVSTEVFGICPRVSGITIGTTDLSSSSSGRCKCVVFAEEVAVEVLDGYDDSIRLFEVAPVISSVGYGADATSSALTGSSAQGISPLAEGAFHMQVAAATRGAYCMHAFPPSASILNGLLLLGDGLVSGEALPAAVRSSVTIPLRTTLSLLQHIAEVLLLPDLSQGVAQKLMIRILELYAKACHPVAYGVVSGSIPASPTRQFNLFSASLREVLQGVVLGCVAASLPAPPTNPPPAAPSIPLVATSFTRLLSVATRHNNMGPQDVCRWRFSDASPLTIIDDGVWELLAAGSIKGPKHLSSKPMKGGSSSSGGGKRYTLEERMERRRKGLPVGDEVDISAAKSEQANAISESLSVNPDVLSRPEHHTVARLCRGGADGATLTKLGLKSEQIDYGSCGVKLSRVCPYSMFSLPTCVAMIMCLTTNRGDHDPDEMVQVRLALSACGYKQNLDGDGISADRSPAPMDTILSPYYLLAGCIPRSSQRPVVVVAFTTATSPALSSEGSVVDGEEDIYNNGSIFPEDDGEEEGGGVEAPSTNEPPADCGLNHHTRPGVARQSGPLRSFIGVFDTADVLGQLGSKMDTPAGPASGSLHPQYVFPLPVSIIPPMHVVKGVAVCWVGGQAHCYISHGLPQSSDSYVSRVVIDDGSRDLVEDIDSDLERDPIEEEELQRAMPEKLAVVRRIQIKEQSERKAITRQPFMEPYLRDVPLGVSLCQLGSGLRDPTTVHPCCPPYGVSKGGRREALTDAGIAAATGQPWHAKRILAEGLPPPVGGSLTSTQREQGFLKRLITTSYADQIGKLLTKGRLVEARAPLLYFVDPKSGALHVVRGGGSPSSPGRKADAHFDDFLANVEASRLRGMTPAEKKRALLEGANRNSRAPRGGTNSAINETKDIMNENRQLLNERGEKIGKLELMTADMAREAETFASLTEQLKRKQRSKWFF